MTSDELNATNSNETNLESIKIHRLFYVEDNSGLNGDDYRMAGDFQNMQIIIEHLRQIDLQKTQIFGTFGDNAGAENYLYSVFPNSQSQIKSLFTNVEQIPTIWTIFNSLNLVFLLICNENITLEKNTYFTIVMQRFLQDVCQNIIICPSETFFVNFSTEHSFHGKPHGSRTYKIVKKELFNIQAPQNVNLDDKNILKSLLDEQCRNVLITNNSSITYCVRKTLQEANLISEDDRFTKLGELLKAHFDISTVNLRKILDLCENSRVFLSYKQKTEIEKLITTYVQLYNNDIVHIDHEAKSSIQELIGISKVFGSIRHETEKEFRKQLYQITKNWLINPNCSQATAEDCAEYIINSLQNHLRSKHSSPNIKPQERLDFISRLKKNDKKNIVRQFQENCTDLILLEAKSENQFNIHFDIYPLQYISHFNSEHYLEHVTVNSSAPIQITFHELNLFMNLSELSEADRLALSRKIKLIACFNTNDGKSEIIVINRPNIINGRLSENTGYTILLHKSGCFKKISDYARSAIHFAYASNQNSQTLVFYHINTREVTRWSLTESGEMKIHSILQLSASSHKPDGVKSLALTVAQNLLILIDSTSTVYSIDISGEEIAFTSLLYKSTNNSTSRTDFKSDDGELYQTVQTIGEKNPIF
ncbi:unnamed protein product, partial [Rotaria sp. Silwood1]